MSVKGLCRQRVVSCAFFFSSRRRHTRLVSDWSSDVCSSDLHTLHERLVLTRVSSPFIVPLKWSFQSESKLYLVLAYVNGGELFHHLQREQKFDEERSRFYAAELLLALEHLHQLNIVYRDLKPENILCVTSFHLFHCEFDTYLGERTDST